MTRRLIAAFCLASAFALSLRAQSDSGFTAWARNRAVLLDSSGRAFRSLDTSIAGARLIAVGESVHEIRQFMELRFALMKYLVQRHHVTAIILESGLPEAIAVDDWIRGRVDSIDFSSALGPDYNSSVVIRHAMQWLHDWNRGPGKAHPVAVYGADISIGDGRSMLPALDRLKSVAGDDGRVIALVDSLRSVAARIAAPWWNVALRNYNALSPAQKVQLTTLTNSLMLATRAWTGGDENQRSWAERFALLAQQDEVVLRAGPFSSEAPRDAAMAANTRWIVDRLPAGERAVLWAHNAHVQRVLIKGDGLPPGVFPGMGYRLGRDLAGAYVAIGTAYGGPSIDSASVPRPGSVDAAMSALDRGPLVLTLRDAPRVGDVAAWLSVEREMRFEVGHLRLPLGSAFDAIAYFDGVTIDRGAR